MWINSYYKLNLNYFINLNLILGLYEECLFDEAYSTNGHKANIISAYELVSGSRKNCKTIIDVDAVDVASVLVMWLYYLPEPLISSKQFSMICGNLTIYSFIIRNLYYMVSITNILTKIKIFYIISMVIMQKGISDILKIIQESKKTIF